MKYQTIKRKFNIVFLAGLITVLGAFGESYAAKGKHKEWIDPAKAVNDDPDFSIQGEYGSAKAGAAVGVQVVALGNGSFDAYVLQGGLPGLGWTREKGRSLLRGTTDGDKITFVPSSNRTVKINEKISGMIRSGKFLLNTESGKQVTLNRIERKSPTLAAKPPKGAIVLFDGTSTEHWKNGQVENGYLKATGAMSKQLFTDYSLHLEFRTPYMPTARGQGRGNSGIYHSGRWETQVLDSFGLEGRDNEAGGIYSVSKPRLNMCLPPLAWQTYDVDFIAAKFDADGKRTAWPRITVRLNGVLVHENLELPKNYTTSAPITSEVINPMGPIYLQNHTNPVVYRNIWVTTPTTNKSESAPVSFGMGKVDLVSEKTIQGRKVIRYEHDSYADWGYAKPQRDYFNVVPVANKTKNIPLRVILHGAGKSGDKAMTAGLAEKDGLMHFYGDERFCLLYLDCRKNKANDWWWGFHNIKRAGDTYKDSLTPAEKRVLSTIEWVVEKYNIDRNRIYLSGVSMGGSGSLGLGMCRGDIFAAINVMVPAGIGHFSHRMENSTHPEPAPVVNFSSHTDRWAKGQEDFMSYMHKNKYLTIYAWGPFGHTADAHRSESAVIEFPWLDIVKNQAYPAFTNATTNQKYPGLMNKQAADQKGQINGFFRWENLKDDAKNFGMELRLVTKKELKKPVDTPHTAVADVTLRRLQNFKIEKNAKYKWSMVRNGKVLQTGQVSPDKQGLITIKGLKIEAEAAVLTLK